ncbi:hypothetical protein [Clostridium sediminicola]|uniref:hypothetical protein n=1 Tax=Clostridium sediminicola TaxID=3114879 RepID=UPI003D168E82
MYKSNFAVESIDMSLSALTRGLEWNYRITKKHTQRNGFQIRRLRKEKKNRVI